MYMLTQVHGSNLYYGSIEAMIIANNQDFSRLQFNKNLENIEKVIIPLNPTNSSWILLLLDINNCELSRKKKKNKKKLSIFDPLCKLCEGSRNFESCHNVAAGIFNDKFGQKIFRMKPLQYVQQTDS